MGKHKKHGYGHKSSSSSSSSSSDSDDAQYRHLPKHERKRMKKLRKQMKKGKIPPGSVPGMYPGGHGAHGYPGGPPHGGHHPHGAPGYPGQPAYPPAGGYPTGVAPPPPAGGYAPPPYAPAPAGGFAPPPGGYPGGAAGYPPPPAQPYPGQQPYPGGPPPPAGGYPGSTAPPPTGSTGVGGFAAPPGAPSGAPPTGYGSGVKTGPDFTQPNPYPAVPPQPVGGPSPGYPQGGYPQPGGAPPPQPGYPQPGGAGYQQPGMAPPGQPGMVPPGQPGMPPPGQPGMPPPGQPGYPQPGGMPPGQMGPGVVGDAAAQFQRMGIQGTADLPRPTIRPAQNFSAERDADIIRKAMKGMGTDEKAIIDVISQRSNQQRQEIMRMFKTMYGKDLIRDLESELSGDVRETIMALFKATTYYDAWSLYQAMSGMGTKESTLIEILCTRTNAEIREINDCYKQYYHRTLEKDIMDDTSGHFKRLLVSCCQANRAELTPQQLQRVQYEGAECVIDRNLARDDAQKLYQAGEKKLGTDESVFLQVMAVRHYYQLRATFEEYVRIAGRDILSSIDREMSGDLKEAFKAIVKISVTDFSAPMGARVFKFCVLLQISQLLLEPVFSNFVDTFSVTTSDGYRWVMCAKNRPEYFADKLYSAMKGAGTHDSTLIRVVVSRSEIDLQDVKEVYLFKYHKTLGTAISSDTSGDYKRLLLAIAGQ